MSAEIMEKDSLAPRFLVAKGNLMVTLICSDYACLGWCKLPQNCEWREILGPSLRNGLTLVVWGVPVPQSAPAELPTLRKMCLKSRRMIWDLQ
jgi:hypothetical protein